MRMDISQPPLNTSLLGVIRGVADFYGIELSTPFLYGLTGHAFLINIHEQLCPSSPYVCDMEPFTALLENAGLAMTGLGFYHAGSTAEERAVLEDSLRSHLDSGRPCSMVNMDNQIISGYDDSGFICIQPWECDFPPAHLAFGSWKELGDEIHASFFSFEKVRRLDPAFSIQRSLLYALDLLNAEFQQPFEKYHCGFTAYDAWISGVENGHGSGHGNWWNGTVWSECRKMGSEYFKEISEGYPACSDTALKLAGLFGEIAERLSAVANKELEKDRKLVLLREAREKEEKALPSIKELAESIET